MSGVEVTVYIALFVLCVLLSAFFSSSEIAFMSFQRIRLEHIVSKKVAGSGRVARLLKQPAKLLSTILLGNNLVQTLATSLFAALAIHYWGERQGVLITTIVVTAILLVFADTAPKTLAAHHSERLSIAFSRPLEIISWLANPLVVGLSWIAYILSKPFGGTPVPRSLATEEEIKTMIMVGEREGTVEAGEARMLHKVFEFTDVTAREVMIPRAKVLWVEQGTQLTDFLAMYARSPRSRYPVYRDNRDNATGVISVKDVLMAIARGAIKDDQPIDNLVRPAYFAPETKGIDELLTEMQARNCRLAIIVNEYGGTAGIVRLSLLLEKIVGPIRDEMVQEEEYKLINENTYQLDGAMRIEEANAKVKLDLPEGDYETVAGFILSRLGHIPKLNELLRYKSLKITVSELDGRKIKKVLVKREGYPPPSYHGQ